MPTRTKQKKANKTKPKRGSVSFEKEAWYAAAAARFSAARPNHTKGLHHTSSVTEEDVQSESPVP